MSNFPANIICETSTITDGNMSFGFGDIHEVLDNRTQFLAKNEIQFKNHICMKCDHGDIITPIDWSNIPTTSSETSPPENMIVSEVLVTKEKGLALMLLTADCLPVSFYDPVTQTIALVHFSRQTIADMLPKKTVAFLHEHSHTDPSDLLVHIGPYIHTESYSFPLPQPDLSPAIAPFVSKTDTQAHIDLLSACIQQLTDAGVFTKNITSSDVDTAISQNHFSHFRSIKQNSPEGRLATILIQR